MLIPFGLALSFVAYVLRYDAARWRSILGPTGLLVLVTAAVAFDFVVPGRAARTTACALFATS